MAPAKQISTSVGFQDSKGTVVANGMLMLQLSQTCTVTASGGQVTTEPIYLNLDANGKISNTAIWFSDELSPSGTIYYGTVYASNKTRMIPGLEKLQYSITGAGPYDLATAVQSAAASPSYSGAVLLTPSGNQTITTGNLTLTSGNLTLTSGFLSATTIKNASLNGAGNGNAVTLLNSQDVAGAVTGNGTDQTVYTYTVPANTVQAGKGFSIAWAILNNSAAALAIKVVIGTTTLWTATTGAASNNVQGYVTITNKAGVQNSQNHTAWAIDGGTIILNNTGGTALAENFANSVIVKITANFANPNTYTPRLWKITLDQ